MRAPGGALRVRGAPATACHSQRARSSAAIWQQMQHHANSESAFIIRGEGARDCPCQEVKRFSYRLLVLPDPCKLHPSLITCGVSIPPLPHTNASTSTTSHPLASATPRGPAPTAPVINSHTDAASTRGRFVRRCRNPLGVEGERGDGLRCMAEGCECGKRCARCGAAKG